MPPEPQCEHVEGHDAAALDLLREAQREHYEACGAYGCVQPATWRGSDARGRYAVRCDTHRAQIERDVRELVTAGWLRRARALAPLDGG